MWPRPKDVRPKKDVVKESESFAFQEHKVQVLDSPSDKNQTAFLKPR